MSEWRAEAAIPSDVFYAANPQLLGKPKRQFVDPQRRTIHLALPVKDDALVELMADIMVERASSIDDCCSEADLQAAGFTLAEIRRLREGAARRARQRC